MRQRRWQILLGSALVLLSVMLYALHYAIFHDAHHIFIYMLGDLAFLPLEVLLVTMVIHELLNQREKRAMLDKLNMIIGAFYSEVGTSLLARVSNADPGLDAIRKDLLIATDWPDTEFLRVRGELGAYDYRIDSSKVDLVFLRDMLVSKRDFMLRLLENPNLLEHESFTELLWAVFHLTEELEARDDLTGVDGVDREHLRGDIERAYGLLSREWFSYMRHLKNSYPYLFSLALRTNPFDREASAVVV